MTPVVGSIVGLVVIVLALFLWAGILLGLGALTVWALSVFGLVTFSWTKAIAAAILIVVLSRIFSRTVVTS